MKNHVGGISTHFSNKIPSSEKSARTVRVQRERQILNVFRYCRRIVLSHTVFIYLVINRIHFCKANMGEGGGEGGCVAFSGVLPELR